jgi:hypothetical protein
MAPPYRAFPPKAIRTIGLNCHPGATRSRRAVRKTSFRVQLDASISVPKRFCGRTRQRVHGEGWIAMIKIALMSALIVGGASVALAQDAAAPAAASDVPLCSKTITDKCMNPTAAPKKTKAWHHKKATTKAGKQPAKAEDKPAA